jgi:hypothetical protein
MGVFVRLAKQRDLDASNLLRVSANNHDQQDGDSDDEVWVRSRSTLDKF